MTVPFIGYVDRFSARPGGRIEVKVSSTLGGSYAADLVRVRHGDPNPDGPGIRFIPLPSGFAGTYPARFQPTPLGSYARIEAPELDTRMAFTLVARVQPWLLSAEPRTVAARLDASGDGWQLAMTSSGASFTVRAGGQEVAVAVAAPPVTRRWYELTASFDGRKLALDQKALAVTWGASDSGSAEIAADTQLACPPGAAITVGAAVAGTDARDHFDGRIEDPRLYRGVRRPGVSDPDPADPNLLAWWDFSRGIDTQMVEDSGPSGLAGTLVNLPTRAVCGSLWTGEEHAWKHAPRHYAAIHFHSDDLGDAGWATDFVVDIPADMKSGAYGVRLRTEGYEDVIPFYVVPPKGKTTAPVVFLASTFTFQVYANYNRFNCDEGYKARRTAWNAYPYHPDEHHDFGHSTYNFHPDGSGIAYSSRLRPIINFRAGYLSYEDLRGSGLRHYPSDTHLLDWLEEKGIAYDVITDEELDEEGLELLRPYKVLVTGTHPEYHTPRTLDAIQDYVGQGGRLVYLGGNGFYWKVARRFDLPHVVEIRRGEGGIRAWAAESGEYYNALDGTYGGLWRRNGRPPQKLAGVGFSGQGKFEGSYYRRLPASYDPAVSWIFAGVEGDTIGDFGLSGGGAAGFELDRADPVLGTPPNAYVLARSEGHQDHFVTVPEELLTHLTTVTGEPPADLIRAELVYFETVKGGAVFSTGSITFCGSLSHDGYDNQVSRMLENVVRRFSA
ncbi:N,N-dimethylformamidase [Stella humosa]|uniref:N,N-dimethylformamidase n=1 Tax=Stella humosa TaxID=94 RepID=A0A3N1MCH0_9PROT|nr:N,N-dimethylformamidase beta subunit family domain-containing protein [Stella humosa]ROQ00407.1 N,N-dimethylformamidase [Stella humosa]BBK30350.1 N,N-dimethylformamidase [Stella humosa]